MRRASLGDARGALEWDVQFGDRRPELVCIGRALDHDAARAQLDECLLTAEEMEANVNHTPQLAGAAVCAAAGWGGAARA